MRLRERDEFDMDRVNVIENCNALEEREYEQNVVSETSGHTEE